MDNDHLLREHQLDWLQLEMVTSIEKRELL